MLSTYPDPSRHENGYDTSTFVLSLQLVACQLQLITSMAKRCCGSFCIFLDCRRCEHHEDSDPTSMYLIPQDVVVPGRQLVSGGMEFQLPLRRLLTLCDNPSLLRDQHKIPLRVLFPILVHGLLLFISLPVFCD